MKVAWWVWFIAGYVVRLLVEALEWLTYIIHR